MEVQNGKELFQVEQLGNWEQCGMINEREGTGGSIIRNFLWEEERQEQSNLCHLIISDIFPLPDAHWSCCLQLEVVRYVDVIEEVAEQWVSIIYAQIMYRRQTVAWLFPCHILNGAKATTRNNGFWLCSLHFCGLMWGGKNGLWRERQRLCMGRTFTEQQQDEEIISKAPIILNSKPVLACVLWELWQVNLFSGSSILKRAPISVLEKRKR